MARYTYYCADCDQHLEVTKSIVNCNDPEPCGGCGKNMKRLYTPIHAIFRGGGWGSKP